MIELASDNPGLWFTSDGVTFETHIGNYGALSREEWLRAQLADDQRPKAAVARKIATRAYPGDQRTTSAAARLGPCLHGWRRGGAAGCGLCSVPQDHVTRYRPRSAIGECPSCHHCGPMSLHAICETCATGGSAHVGRYRTWCCNCAGGYAASYAPADVEVQARSPVISRPQRLSLGTRTMPWPVIHYSHARSRYGFIEPRIPAFRYTGMPDPASWNPLPTSSSDWRGMLASRSRKRYRDNGIERFFRPLENDLLRSLYVSGLIRQCEITNEYFTLGERGPRTSVSPTGAARLRKRHKRMEDAIAKRNSIPMPSKRRGDEDFVRCPCCLLWIDLNALGRLLNPHVPRGFRGENELLKFPGETPGCFRDATFTSNRSPRDDPIGFGEVNGPRMATFDGVSIRDRDVKFALSWDRRKGAPSKRRRRLPLRLREEHWLTSDCWREQEVSRGARIAPISKLRDFMHIVEGSEDTKPREAHGIDSAQLEGMKLF